MQRQSRHIAYPVLVLLTVCLILFRKDGRLCPLPQPVPAGRTVKIINHDTVSRDASCADQPYSPEIRKSKLRTRYKGSEIPFEIAAPSIFTVPPLLRTEERAAPYRPVLLSIRKVLYALRGPPSPTSGMAAPRCS